TASSGQMDTLIGKLIEKITHTGKKQTLKGLDVKLKKGVNVRYYLSQLKLEVGKNFYNEDDALPHVEAAMDEKTRKLYQIVKRRITSMPEYIKWVKKAFKLPADRTELTSQFVNRKQEAKETPTTYYEEK